MAEAANAEAALTQAAQDRYDIALLELHLPGMSGIDRLAKLKERQPELEALMPAAHGSIATAIFVLSDMTKEHKQKGLVRELQYLLDCYRDDASWEGIN